MAATQRDIYTAEWVSDDHHYSAMVERALGRRAVDHKVAWRWSLYWPGGHGSAADGDLIWVPWDDEAEPLDVLASLASFVGAWQESRYLGSPASDNWDLFSDEFVEFLDAAEEFSLWASDHNHPYDPEEVG